MLVKKKIFICHSNSYQNITSDQKKKITPVKTNILTQFYLQYQIHISYLLEYRYRFSPSAFKCNLTVEFKRRGKNKGCYPSFEACHTETTQLLGGEGRFLNYTPELENNI